MRHQFIVGHRGARGLAPENTLLAFQKGIECGTQSLECDVQITKDGELVVFHDTTLDRLTSETGWVHERTLIELESFFVLDSEERIPSLEKVVDLVFSSEQELIIEIKGDSKERAVGTAERVVSFLGEKKIDVSKIYIHSFCMNALARVNELDPSFHTSLLFCNGLETNEYLDLAKRVGADGISVAYDYIYEDLVTQAQKVNMRIDAWTLNNELVFNRMKDMGVNGLITDFPDRFRL